MINLDPKANQRFFTLNVDLDQHESQMLFDIANELGVKRSHLALFAADLLGEALTDDPEFYRLVTEAKDRRLATPGKTKLFNLKSQLAVPGSWTDPVAIMEPHGVASQQVYRFAVISFLEEIDSPSLLQAAKDFCTNYQAFSLAKVKGHHFLLSKATKPQQAPAHRGFTIYNPDSFNN